MQHTFLVCIVHRLRNRLYKLRSRSWRERMFPNKIAKALPLDVLHREIVLPFAFANFVNSDDVRMPQVSCRFGLGIKPFDVPLVGKLSG